MIDSLENELDINNKKILNLEKDIAEMQDIICELGESIKETQRYLVKLAHNQQEITKRIASWPFLTIEKK